MERGSFLVNSFFVFGIIFVFWGCGQGSKSPLTGLASLSSEEVGFGDPSRPDFFVLSDGLDLKKYDATRLQTRTGKGNAFSNTQKKSYESLKKKSGVYWVVRDMASGDILAKSKDTETNVYGASVPKIIVAASALYKNDGRLKTESLWKALIRLLVDSENNPAWDEMQAAAGGKDGINAFTKMMGYKKMRAARYDGNAVNAIEMSQFYFDVLNGKFTGSEVVFKVASACNTANDRSFKYYTKDIYAGGKTGTYESANHDTRFLRVNGKWYSIVVLTTLGNSENVAVMHGGLLREFILGNYTPPVDDPDNSEDNSGEGDNDGSDPNDSTDSDE